MGISITEWIQAGTAVATLLVGLVALFLAVGALRTQRMGLPVAAQFGLGSKIRQDSDGVRWIWCHMKNLSSRVYVHDVSPHEWMPDDLDDELTPNLARVGMPDSLPPWLDKKSKRALRRTSGIFNPHYLRTNAYTMFWVSCPPGVEKVKFTAAVGITRGDPLQFVSSEWIDVPI